MLLWVILSLLTAATVVAVLQPLRRKSGIDASDQPALVAVYKDQLAEIETDLERGLISDGEASATRLEVQRRLLRLDGQEAARTAEPVAKSRAAALATMVVVPLLAVSAYAVLGSPNLPGQPLSVRRAATPERAQVEILVARVEEQLRLRPEDGRGWEVLAPVYARLGRAADSLEAWRQTIRLSGPTPARLRGLVEASLAVTQGIVDGEARGALETLRAGDPADPIPRFWLAIAKQQNGEREAAISDLQALLDSASTDAAWRDTVAERLAELRAGKPAAGGRDAAGATAIAVPAPAPPAAGVATAPRGPSAEQMAAAQQMSAEDRTRMIAGMVDGLAARLEKDGSDVEGWLRLINAYSVLDRKTDAQAAVAKARKAFGGEAAALARLDAVAKELGL